MIFTSLSKPRIRLADQVYNQILQAIHNHVIMPNERIVQEKLADELQISRTPVREALLRMEQEGILQRSKHGGFIIRKLTTQEIAEIYDTRASIEGFAARLLAERNDKKLNDQLRQVIRKKEAMIDHNVHTYFQTNLTIHRIIVEATGNHLLLEFFDNLWNRGSSYTLFAAIYNVDLAESLGDHVALIDTIETGVGSVAAERMINHIRAGLQLQIRAI